MRLPGLFRNRTFRAAFQVTVGLWGFVYILLEVLLIVTGRWARGGSLLTVAIEFVTSISLAGCLIAAVLALASAPLGRRLAGIAVTFAIVVVIQGLVDLTSNWMIAELIDGRMTWATFDMARYLRVSFIYVWVFALNLVLIYVSLYHSRVRDQGVELAEAKAQAVQAQLAMLRYQLNPHFLFNTLNAISTLVVMRRAEEAEEMIARLSNFLRSSLVATPGEFVTLDVELNVVQEYLEIEAVRFGDGMAVDFACDEHARGMLVPSFILQPLVENAIKYAVGPSIGVTTIKVDARLDGGDLVMLVSDDGDAEKAKTRGGTGVGLGNVRARLAALYGERASLEAVPLERGFLAIVRLPATPAREAA
jgi:hypothetical protein